MSGGILGDGKEQGHAIMHSESAVDLQQQQQPGRAAAGGAADHAGSRQAPPDDAASQPLLAKADVNARKGGRSEQSSEEGGGGTARIIGKGATRAAPAAFNPRLSHSYAHRSTPPLPFQHPALPAPEASSVVTPG